MPHSRPLRAHQIRAQPSRLPYFHPTVSCTPHHRLASQVSGERVERRLAAILAADVAGYSRLMGEDEEGTLAH
jgi:class 3 adenylate cyclase